MFDPLSDSNFQVSITFSLHYVIQELSAKLFLLYVKIPYMNDTLCTGITLLIRCSSMAKKKKKVFFTFSI